MITNLNITVKKQIQMADNKSRARSDHMDFMVPSQIYDKPDYFKMFQQRVIVFIPESVSFLLNDLFSEITRLLQVLRNGLLKNKILSIYVSLL